MKISIKIMLLLLLVSTGGKAQTIQKTTVYFDFDKAELTPETTHKLDSIAKFINKYIAKVIKIEIAGHTDSMGMNDYNDRLSNLRANAVNDYLLAKKIPDTLIKKVDAFGKRMPVSNNHDSVERSKNRRVEISTYFVKNNAAKTTPQPKTDLKDGYIPHKTFNPKLEDLDKIPDIDSGTTIVIPNLIFVGGSHELVSSSTTALVKIYKLMKENPNLKIELQGHVCCHYDGMGPDGYDVETRTNNLSENRAKAVYDYLIKNGIERKRLAYRGFGGMHKLVEEITEDDRARNRRVEIRILEK